MRAICVRAAWLVGAGLILHAAPARAEANTDPCASYHVGLAPAAVTIPSNIPAVGYFTPGGWTLLSFSLEDPNGLPIAVGADTPALFGWVAKPLSASLPEGKSYKITLSAHCVSSSGSVPTTAIETFDVGPDSPLPTSIGTATILPLKPDEPHPTIFELSVTFTPEMKAYLGVAAVWVKQGTAYRAEPRYEAPYQLPLTMLLTGTCSQAQVGQQVQVPIEVGADILGAATQPPKLSLTMEYECPDASTPPITDGGEGATNPAESTQGGSDCGCHAAPAAFSGVAISLLTLAGIGIAGSRWKIRRH
jgi:hypothetical protein